MRFIVILLGFFLSCSIAFATLTLTVPDTFNKESQPAWDALLYRINNSNEDVVLWWYGYGGSVDYANYIFKKLRESKKNIQIEIIGPSISMHAMVLCVLPDKVSFKNSYAVFHGVFVGHLFGKKIYSDSMTRSLMSSCVQNKVLTQFDVDMLVKYNYRIEVYPTGDKIFKEDWK